MERENVSRFRGGPCRRLLDNSLLKVCNYFGAGIKWSQLLSPPPVSKVSQSFHLSSRLTFFDRKLLLPAIVQRDHQAFPLPPSNALTLSRFGSRFILPYSHPLCDHRSMTSATIQRVFQLVPRVLRGFRRYCESSIYCEARNDTVNFG